MARVRCKTCGKWWRDRCMCPSKQCTSKQPKKQKPENQQLRTAQDDRRLELQVELAKVQLLQALLEVRENVLRNGRRRTRSASKMRVGIEIRLGMGSLGGLTARTTGGGRIRRVIRLTTA